MRRLIEATAILIPVPRGGDFRKNLASRIAAVIAGCRGAVGEAVVDGVFEDDTMTSAPADDL